MKLAIITGASKGLGASIAENLLNKGIGILTLSRTENKELRLRASEKKVNYSHFSCDLTSASDLEQTMITMIEDIITINPEELYVFNNAAVISPIGNIGTIDHSELLKHTQINFNAPVMITNMLLKLTLTNIQIINISSGAGERPIQGWSIYNSTKAAINMFTKTVALEQKTAGTNHQIIAFNPGIMDTGMQESIRSSSQENFYDLAKFKNYKQTGLLKHPETVAAALIHLCLNEPVESGTVYQIADLLKK
ncbi:SDR family NAD(P)-dependent oxidoreductase [Cytobacillus purgationiresistens]|uniref:Benzil reductase ((S)-benzoin forming) n=1 Tax=Cytobacillus purgationiresistens TaxID=863449 RepID=A0ABU0AP88_9BACI|nr:SDR family NAD(P)-dependent oxidoreductase [Cytobacillus purgationiresistens]MDQ0273010.1 benzil reductase ((S)-benzoin forming) [Cytobacillus purgationiresistens]